MLLIIKSEKHYLEALHVSLMKSKLKAYNCICVELSILCICINDWRPFESVTVYYHTKIPQEYKTLNILFMSSFYTFSKIYINNL